LLAAAIHATAEKEDKKRVKFHPKRVDKGVVREKIQNPNVGRCCAVERASPGQSNKKKKQSSRHQYRQPTSFIFSLFAHHLPTTK